MTSVNKSMMVRIHMEKHQLTTCFEAEDRDHCALAQWHCCAGGLSPQVRTWTGPQVTAQCSGATCTFEGEGSVDVDGPPILFWVAGEHFPVAQINEQNLWICWSTF